MERKEWLENRKKGIGSSDAAAVHNLSPYITRYGLYMSKVSETVEEAPMNFAMNMGNEFEPRARAKFASLHNIENFTDETFDPVNIEMKDLPFMKASLDGASKDMKIITEFKYQGVKEHAKTGDESLSLHERVRMNYWIQVQHQLLVSGAEVAWFVSFNGESLTMLKIEPDLEFMKKHLDECCKFWTMVEARTPPPLTIDDYTTLKVAGATALAREWKKTRDPEIASQLMKMCKKDHHKLAGIKFTKIENDLYRMEIYE